MCLTSAEISLLKRFRLFLICLLLSVGMGSCAPDENSGALTPEQQSMDIESLRRELTETRAAHSRMIRRLTIALEVIYLSGAVAFGIILYRRKLRRDEYYFQIGQNIREITELRQRDSAAVNSLLRELLTKEYRVMDEKCREYYEKSSPQTRKNLSDEAVELVERLSSADRIAELEETVNRYQSGVMERFRRDLPDLKADDYKLFLYSILGFSSTAIAVFLKAEKIESVYNRKRRLKTKIRQLPDPSAISAYLEYL